MANQVHIVFTEKEASQYRRKVFLLWTGQYAVFALLFSSAILVSETSKIGAAALLIAMVVNACFSMMKLPFLDDVKELNGSQYKEVNDALLELPELQPIFSSALSTNKVLRERDYDFVREHYAPFKNAQDKALATHSIKGLIP